MAPVQLFFLVSALVILPFAWVKGGHPERAGVAVFVAAYVSGPFVQGLRMERLLIGVAISDVLVWAMLLWLALRYNRWWLLSAAAAQGLNVISHLAVVMTPSLTWRESIAAQWLFGLVSFYSLLSGVVERRMAGERPAAPPLGPVSRRPIKPDAKPT